MAVFVLPKAGFVAAGEFVAGLNALPQHHVGYVPEDPAAATKALLELEPTPGNVFATGSSEKLTGLIALEYDEALGRAWFWGPWCAAGAWEEQADLLYAAASAAAPPAVHLFELWFDTRHDRLRDLAERNGFTLYKRAFPYGFDRDGLARVPAGDVGVAAPGYGESLAALHESCFPNSYYSGSQVLEKPAEPGGKFMLLAEGDGDACHGYVFLEVDAEVGEAHIHFLAVAQSHRRRGLGRRLLIAGMHWMFSHPAVDRVGLIVDPDNAGALRLYQATGWTRERETEAWRRTRE